MRTGILVLAVAGLILAPALFAAEPAQKDEKDQAVRQIEVKLQRSGRPRGKVDAPTVITNAKELAQAFPEENVQEQLKKEVDFQKQQILFFAWSGSGGDKLEPRVEKGKKGEEVIFAYKPGLTRDLRIHYRVYVLPRDATWKVDKK